MTPRQTTEADLFRIEKTLRQYAEVLLLGNPSSMLSDPAVGEEVRRDVRRKLSAAADMKTGADIMQGLQGAGWSRMGPEVRDGYTRAQREYEDLKARGQANADDEKAA